MLFSPKIKLPVDAVDINSVSCIVPKAPKMM